MDLQYKPSRRILACDENPVQHLRIVNTEDDGRSTLTDYKGQIQLSIRAINEASLSLHVIVAAGLKSSLPLSNSFVTAGLIPSTNFKKDKSENIRTKTVVCSNQPTFNETLRIDITMRSSKSRLFVAVWNKLPDKRATELVGVTSYSLTSCLTRPILGWFYLLPESIGARKHMRAETAMSDALALERKESQRSVLSDSTNTSSSDCLYMNTAEPYYKRPQVATSRKIPTLRDFRKPAPSSHPPPVPFYLPVTDPVTSRTHYNAGSLSSLPTSGSNCYSRKSGISGQGSSQTSSLTDLPSTVKIHSKRRGSPDGKAKKHRYSSAERIYGNVQELEKFPKPAQSKFSIDSCDEEDIYQVPFLTGSQPPSRTQSLDRKFCVRMKQSLPRKEPSRASGSDLTQGYYRHYLSTIYSPSTTGESSQSSSALDWTNQTDRQTSERRRLERELGSQLETRIMSVTKGPDGYGFSLSDTNPVRVCWVEAGSRAESSGVMVDDIIASVDDEPTCQLDSLQIAALISNKRHSMQLTVWRDPASLGRQLVQPDKAPGLLVPSKRKPGKLATSKSRKKLKTSSKNKKGSSNADRQKKENPSAAMLPLLSHLYEVESSFVERLRPGLRYHANELHLSGKICTEEETTTLFNNLDELLQTSSYFSSKLDIVLRRAERTGKLIATADDIYLPRVAQLRENYLLYMSGVVKAENLIEELIEKYGDLGTPCEELQEMIPLESLIHTPIDHIESVIEAFNRYRTSIPEVHAIERELQPCLNLMNQLWPQSVSDLDEAICRSPSPKTSASKSRIHPAVDQEVVELQDRLEFASKVQRFDLSSVDRHIIYFSPVRLHDNKYKHEAYLLSDLILLVQLNSRKHSANHTPGFDKSDNLLVVQEPISLHDVKSVHLSTTNDCSLTIRYRCESSGQQESLSLITGNAESRVVWKGLILDRMKRVHAAGGKDLTLLSDQGIQVSESSEGSDNEDVYSPAIGRKSDQSRNESLETNSSNTESLSTDSPGAPPLSISMTVLPSDNSPSPLLTSDKLNTGSTEHLQRADYTKHLAKQATTKLVHHRNHDNTSNRAGLHGDTSNRAGLHGDTSNRAGLHGDTSIRTGLHDDTSIRTSLHCDTSNRTGLHGDTQHNVTPEYPNVAVQNEARRYEVSAVVNDGDADKKEPIYINFEPADRHAPPLIDLSAILEESEGDLTNTSLHVSSPDTDKHLSSLDTSEAAGKPQEFNNSSGGSLSKDIIDRNLSGIEMSIKHTVVHDVTPSECHSTPNRDSLYDGRASFGGGVPTAYEEGGACYENLVIDHISLLENRNLASIDTSSHDNSSNLNTAGESKCELPPPNAIPRIHNPQTSDINSGEITTSSNICPEEIIPSNIINPGDITPSSNISQLFTTTLSSTDDITALSDSEAISFDKRNSERRNKLSHQKSFSEENINITFEEQRYTLAPVEPNPRAVFTFGEGHRDSPGPSTGMPELDGSYTTNSITPPRLGQLPGMSPPLSHVESENIVSSSAKRRMSIRRIIRSKSLAHSISLNQEQCGSKEETRQRKFSTVASRWMRAKNVRNVLSFFKKKSTADITAPLPSKEAVELWAQSFSALLADKYGLSLFKDFLCSEYSEENVEFWIACQEYRQLKLKQQASRAQTIYSNFITVHAPREVNLDSKTRLETMKSLNDPDKSTFDLAQAKIQCLMEKDSYPRFLRSTFYTDIVTKINIS